MTAAHVVENCERIVVQLPDRRVVAAEKLGADPDTDIALLRLPVPPARAPLLGDADAWRPGDWVLAVGEPYGMNRSVSAGIVGGTNRHFAEDEELLYIQSDVALNPGNSGGPLLDVRGAIVSMNMRAMIGSYGSVGVSLSVPIDVVLQIAAELKAGGIRRPRLGAHFQDVSAPEAALRGRPHAGGALVALVHNGSLAERFGLRVGDIVVDFNGRAVGRSSDLARALLAWRQPAATRFTVYRAGGFHELRLQ